MEGVDSLIAAFEEVIHNMDIFNISEDRPNLYIDPYSPVLIPSAWLNTDINRMQTLLGFVTRFRDNLMRQRDKSVKQSITTALMKIRFRLNESLTKMLFYSTTHPDYLMMLRIENFLEGGPNMRIALNNARLRMVQTVIR